MRFFLVVSMATPFAPLSLTPGQRTPLNKSSLDGSRLLSGQSTFDDMSSGQGKGQSSTSSDDFLTLGQRSPAARSSLAGDIDAMLSSGQGSQGQDTQVQKIDLSSPESIKSMTINCKPNKRRGKDKMELMNGLSRSKCIESTNDIVCAGHVDEAKLFQIVCASDSAVRD